MLPKAGTELPKTPERLTDSLYAERIGLALRRELGSSRKATKMVARWTGASDRSARTWVNGLAGPRGVHLMMLARNSPSVWSEILVLAAHQESLLAYDVHAVEVALAKATAAFEVLRRQRRTVVG